MVLPEMKIYISGASGKFEFNHITIGNGSASDFFGSVLGGCEVVLLIVKKIRT
jgi:hypothetical protein